MSLFFGLLNTNNEVSKDWIEENYVRSSELILAEWSWYYANVGTTLRWPYRGHGWPEAVRTDNITEDSNIEIKCVTFDNEISVEKIKLATVNLKLAVVSPGNNGLENTEFDLLTAQLSGKTVSTLKGHSGDLFTFHLDEKVYVGYDDKIKSSIAYNVGATVTGLEKTGPEITVTFRLNQSGRL